MEQFIEDIEKRKESQEGGAAEANQESEQDNEYIRE